MHMPTCLPMTHPSRSAPSESGFDNTPALAWSTCRSISHPMQPCTSSSCKHCSITHVAPTKRCFMFPVSKMCLLTFAPILSNSLTLHLCPNLMLHFPFSHHGKCSPCGQTWPPGCPCCFGRHSPWHHHLRSKLEACGTLFGHSLWAST